MPHEVLSLGVERGRPVRAFTVVELLVAVGVVLAVAALFFPVLQKGRGASQKVTCMQNLRTYHQAVISYATDRNGTIVPYIEYKDRANPLMNELDIWQAILVDGGYLPRAREGVSYVPHSLRCPANRNGYMPGEKSPKGDLRYQYGTPNYLYNTASGRNVRLQSDLDHDRYPAGPMKLADMLVGRKAMFFEGGEDRSWGRPFRCNYVLQSNSMVFDPESQLYAIGDVHNGASHVLFWDGSIETFPAGTIDPKFADWRGR